MAHKSSRLALYLNFLLQRYGVVLLSLKLLLQLLCCHTLQPGIMSVSCAHAPN